MGMKINDYIFELLIKEAVQKVSFNGSASLKRSKAKNDFVQFLINNKKLLGRGVFKNHKIIIKGVLEHSLNMNVVISYALAYKLARAYAKAKSLYFVLPPPEENNN